MSLKDPTGVEAAASIDGAPASLDDAAAAAARLLAQSGQPLIAGLSADIEGTRAAIALAERTGAVIEHRHSAALMRDLDCLRETGVMLVTPGEARVRADVVLLVGDGLTETWPGLAERLLAPPARPEGVDVSAAHRLARAARRTRQFLAFDGDIEIVAAGRGSTLAANLAALRARVKGRPVAQAADSSARARRARGRLKGARFGVAVWTAASLGALEIEMINGLVRDLNETTRFSTLPLAPGDNGAGVLAACGWIMGFPMRTGFGAGAPVHDPWRFDAERLVASGETDCVLWISAFGARAAGMAQRRERHRLVRADGPIRQEAECAHRDRAPRRRSRLRSCTRPTPEPWSPSPPPRRAPTPSVAEALARIGARLAEAHAPPC